MHVALLHDGRPALLRVEGPAGGPVVLFFHPFPLHADAWSEMLEACVRAGLCAAALDAPGFGGTPHLGKPLTMEALADFGAAALDALGANRAAIVGCSMGGYAAMAFARRHPGRMAAAALIATKASADTPEAKQNRERQASLALASGPKPVLAEFVPKLLAPDAPAAVRRRVEELAARATAQGIADALRGMALRPDSTPDLPGWTAPTLVIAGERDQLIPRAEMEKLAQGIPGARIEVIAGAGHLPFLESPSAVAPLLTAHLKAGPRA
ncbi:MAG TPA: alpha/beta hydrolase [Myxococcales bacterium]|jgi:pimeloyl-ACP methyl ester carboxylesterase|nr:alpha/beta hydrolase [Myxococcales bacterium]